MTSFSAAVKRELLANFKRVEEDRYILLGLALLAAGRLHKGELRFSTAHRALADLMVTCLDEEIGLPVDLRQGKELVTIVIKGRPSLDLLTRFWREDFGFDEKTGRLDEVWFKPPADSTEAGSEAELASGAVTAGLAVADQSEADLKPEADSESEAGLEPEADPGAPAVPPAIRTLQAVFLAGGSLAEPTRFYQLELAIRRRPLAEQLMDLMLTLNLPVSLIKRSDYYVLYMKDADGIGDFLALTGAHVARLQFGNYRLKRDLRNHVNRLVNCDSANSRRLADASARQLTSLAALKESSAWDTLPDNLKQTAELRLAYPDLSLRELGELSDPPLAKSGVSHRLKRLLELSEEKAAEDSRKRDQSDDI